MQQRGPFVCFDAFMMDDHRIEALPWDVRGLYVAMALKVRQLRSDGDISEAQIAKLGYPRWRKALSLMKDTGCIQPATMHGQPGWHLPGYLKWNPDELSYLVRSHQGKCGACKRHHEKPCKRVDCATSRTWLTDREIPVEADRGS